MNILVTGANGYIGNSLVQKLENAYKVFQIKNSKDYRHENEIFYMNLLDGSHVERFMDEDLSVDVIIHVASKMASSDNVEDMSTLYDNIKMYEHMVEIVKKYKPKKLINFSSIAVYPNIDGDYDENSLIKPSVNGDALYGLSKFCGENILDYKLRAESTKISHLRVAQVYSDDLRDDRLYMMMKAELNQNNTITVFGNGERISNFIHKELLLEKVLFFIQNECPGIYNLGEKNFSYKEFAEQIIKNFGDDDSAIIFNPKGLRSKVSINIEKIKRLEKRDV